MSDLTNRQRHIDRLYADPSDLKRYVLTHAPAEPEAQSQAAWADLMDAEREISATWAGSNVLQEIRAQREK